MNHPFTMLWYQPMSGHLIPSVRYLLGQDQMTVSAEQATKIELKIQTNLPQVRDIKIITEGQTRKNVLNRKKRERDRTGRKRGRQKRIGKEYIQDRAPGFVTKYNSFIILYVVMW